MKRRILFSTVALMLLAGGAFATDVPGGNVSGTWTKAKSPYNVKGDITVTGSDKLIIEAGVQVNFEGLYKLQVNGVLHAIGSAADTIRFNTANAATGWGGIRFDNSASGANGAMTNNDSSFISFCRFDNGKALTTWPNNSGGAIFGSGFPQMKITNSVFANNESTKGGAIYIENGGYIDSCVFINNTCPASGSGGAFYVKTLGSAQNCMFVGNKAYYGGAVLITAAGGTADGFASIINCKMYDNEATEGGALRSYKGSMINCIAANNKAIQGGGIRTEQTKVINSTIVNNKGTSGNYLLKENTVVNTIFWGNNASSDNNQITTSDTTMVVKYCAVQDGYTGAGAKAGIISIAAGNTDVKFVNPTAFDGHSSGNVIVRSSILNADWRIEEKSKCVDAGENFSFPPNLSGDITGAERVYNNKIDIGAYEYAPAPDTGVGVINVSATMDVAVYPTVTTGSVMISQGGDMALDATVFSTTGQVLYRGSLTRKRNELNVSSYPSGLLYIRLSSGAQVSVHKVFKQ